MNIGKDWRARMCNPQNNREPDLHHKEELPSIESDQQSHFAHARKIVESWPQWKRNIRCMPASLNINQSIESPDKT